jgi:hypothetical protein
MYSQEFPELDDDEVEADVDDMLHDDEVTPDLDEYNTVTDDTGRTAEEILYEERWQPKYPRSARRIPFGHARRLTAVIYRVLGREDGHLGLSQQAMRNHVKEAAEHAEGVDPDQVTIRGLRATAATHYSTYIRFPKVLQDLMGWVRIETARRYLRRAGAFTSEVVYEALHSARFKPAMYPGEPETKYPLIGNPLPYDNEPYDPVPYVEGEREKIKRELDEKTTFRLIHPRSKDPANELEYDPSYHEIHTHEDFEELITQQDGITTPVGAPSTLGEFIEGHERLSPKDATSEREYESPKEYKERERVQTGIDDFHGDEDEYRAQIQSPLIMAVMTYLARIDRLSRQLTKATIDWYRRPPDPPVSLIGRIVIGGLMLLFVSGVAFVALTRTGILDLQTMSLQLRPVHLPAISVALYAIYRLPGAESLSGLFR